MLAFVKKPFRINAIKKTVKYGAFDIQPTVEDGTLFASESRYCDCSGGVLKSGLGLEPKLTEEENAFWVNPELDLPKQFFVLPFLDENGLGAEELGYVTEAGEVYIFSENMRLFIKAAALGGRVTTVLAYDNNQGISILFFGEKGAFRYAKGEMVTPIVYDIFLPIACALEGRVFAAQKGGVIVYFSPYYFKSFTRDIDGAGRVRMPEEAGEIVGLVALDGYAYAFCEFGIFRLEVRGSARDFVIQRIAYQGGRIFEGSVCVSAEDGKKIFFLTENGVCRLLGESVKTLGLPAGLTEKSTGQVCDQAMVDGKYYCSFLDMDGEKKAVIVDAKTEKAYQGFVAQAITSVRGGTLCLADEIVQYVRSVGVLPSGEAYSFIVKDVDFNEVGAKTLKTLKLVGEGGLTLEVDNGHEMKRFSARFVNGRWAMNVRLKGERFTLKFKLAFGTAIKELRAEIAMIGR